ncbi:MAG: proline--tRNA ligase, partial [Amphiplicatus sp.]
DLPKSLYHIQWKFRDEIRPRFGVMRGREFLMKDAYSFDFDREGGKKSYNRMFVAYLRTFARMGLKSIPMRADSGPIGGDSHEFIVLADTGESAVFCDRRLVDMETPGADVDFDGDLQPIIDRRTALYAATEEKHDQAEFEKAVAKDDRIAARGIEVGHIFFFSTKYSEPMRAVIAGPDGKEHPAEMGSYGIGVSRLAGALIEAHHDEAGCKWPVSVAPFHVGLVNLKAGDAATDAACDKAYKALEAAGVEVLYDETGARPGEKFARMDLIGLPYQLIIGPRGLEAGKVEVKRRADGHRDELALDAAIAMLESDVKRALALG